MQNGSPPDMGDFDYKPDVAHDEMQHNYKQLAVEVAWQISPDIQATLAATATNMLSQIRSDGVQHGQHLNDIHLNMQSLEAALEKTANTWHSSGK